MNDMNNDETQNSKDLISRKVFERPIIIGIPIIIFSFILFLNKAKKFFFCFLVCKLYC